MLGVGHGNQGRAQNNATAMEEVLLLFREFVILEIDEAMVDISARMRFYRRFFFEDWHKLETR